MTAVSENARLGWEHQVEEAVPGPSLRRIALLSALTLGLGFGGLLGWAALARLDSAVPAAGTVVAAGKRKTVSLLESGILKELLVHEGDVVAAGQPLLRMEDVQARSAYDGADVVYWQSMARIARLDAEAKDRRVLNFPPDLLTAAETGGASGIAAAVEAERRQFAVRWDALDSQGRVDGRRIAQYKAQIAALDAQIAATRTHIELTTEELRGQEWLLARGFAPRNHVLEMRRDIADMRGQLGEQQAKLTETGQAIAQVEQETASTIETRRADISRERSETEATLADAQQRRRAAANTLAKQVVTAPEAGTVTDIKYFTPGSSIVAGQPVLDLVPLDDRLLIEGSVAPTDIEHVHVGQRVNVRLTAYKVHLVPTLSGHLVYVGADRQVDDRGEPFFLVRAELDPDALAGIKGVRLAAGMPADVLVIGGARTVLDFLLSPIRDSLRHGMKEE
jgi:HlyD family secretion protein